jgi:hypothetical protein
MNTRSPAVLASARYIHDVTERCRLRMQQLDRRPAAGAAMERDRAVPAGAEPGGVLVKPPTRVAFLPETD